MAACPYITIDPTTVYISSQTCTWEWTIQRCFYQRTSSTMTVSVTRYATLYSIVYSSESYECNCVTLQPSSSIGTRTSSSASIDPFCTISTTTGTNITTKSTHSATTGIGTAISVSYTDGATKDTVVKTSTIMPKRSIKSSTISSPIATSEEPTPKECTQPSDSTPVIIGVVMGVVVAILLVVIIIIFVGVILYMKFWKNTREYSPTQSPGKEDRVYDKVETHSETEIKNVQLESNPAYQPITIEGSVQNSNYEEVEMKLTANPTYI